MAKVVWTQEAERWLLKIHDYIAQDKPAAAFKVVESIYARAQILAQFPKLGQGYRTQSGRNARILMWGHYRIVYLEPNELDVHIVACFTARWSWITTSSRIEAPPNKWMQLTRSARGQMERGPRS